MTKQHPDIHMTPAGLLLVYLVEPDVALAATIRDLLEAGGYRVEHFADLASFGGACEREEIPAALVMDMTLGSGADSAPRLIAELRERCLHCPPVIFLSPRDDLESHLSAYRAGASRYLVKPVDGARLLQLLAEISWRQPPEPYRVVMVDDDPLALEVQSAALIEAGMSVRTETAPLRVPGLLHAFRPDILLLDMHMPECTGAELAALLREQDEHAQLPILFLSADNDMERQLLALNLGGDDFLVKPVEPARLVAAVAARARRARQHQEMLARLREALYEREREHLAINQHAIVSIADAAGTITYVNERFCEVSGYRHEELLGRNHRILKSGVHADKFYEDMWRAIAAGLVWQGEICNRRKDGSLYWVESTITPFLDETGKPYQYIAIRTDISRVKAAETTLRTSEERLRRSQVYANIGTWDWNIQTGDLYWSERIAPLFGYQEGALETSYANFLNAVHPDDRQRVVDAVDACVQQGVEYDIEHRCVWPDGTVRWLLERGDVVRGADGKPQHMLGVVQDITARKRAEMALAEQRIQLLEAQRLAQLGNWTADLTTGELLWSEEIYRIFGHVPGSFTPSVAAFHRAVHPDDAELVRASERRAEQTGLHDVVHRIVRPDGDVRYVHELAESVCDANGRVVRLVGTVQDVTDLKRAEQAMFAAKEEAERASQAKSDFLSSMSHELRTPMNAILGFAQLLEYGSVLDEEQRDSVQEILKAGRHLLELINEVLDLAKVESGRIDLSLEPVEVCELVRECYTLVQPLADEHRVRLVHHGLDGAMVRADRIRLKQVLLNLLANAIKYNRDGGSVRVELEAVAQGQMRVIVTDTGQGIPSERLGELFQPFSRLGAEASGVEGTGIGLTITRRLVEMMGGVIGVQSEAGVGSRFWIELPLELMPDQAESVATARMFAVDQAMDAPGRQHTIVYIEDNPANLKLVSHLLGRLPHIHLVTAHTPVLGLELASAHQPDLILLDINMPGMNGYQLLDFLRADARLKAVPIVAITANAMPSDIERGRAAGFTDYLTKPLDVARFCALVDQWLGIGEQA